VAEKMGTKSEAVTTQALQLTGLGTATPRKVVKPPKWVGLAVLALGAVFVLHSLVLRKPG